MKYQKNISKYSCIDDDTVYHTYLFRYKHGGKDVSSRLVATSFEDAEARIKAIGNIGTVDGILYEEIDASDVADGVKERNLITNEKREHRTYLYRYTHEDGYVYGAKLKAKSFEDARKHLQAIKDTATLDGGLALTIDASSLLGNYEDIE